MSEKVFVLVETVETFRMRYVVPLPKGNEVWALDTVVMNEATEFSQKHLGEQIVSHRAISREELLELMDEDNDYAASWSEEQKFKAFVTPEIDEDGNLKKVKAFVTPEIDDDGNLKKGWKP